MTPLIGETIVRYAPTSEARCTIKKFEKKGGEFFGERTTERLTASIYEESPRVLKYSMVGEAAGNYFRMIFGLEADGSGFATTEPAFHVKQSEADPWLNIDDITGKEKEDFVKLRQFLSTAMQKGSSYTGIGKPLRQGSVVSGDMCGVFPQGRTKSASGAFTVVGTTVIQGRNNLIISGGQNLACTFADQEVKMDVKGWYAVDMQSGILGAQSLVASAVVPSKGSTTSTEDRECAVTQPLTQPIAQPPAKTEAPTTTGASDSKSVEQRLTELKSLLGKGLITREQFEQKRSEIVKAL
ncbi:SHOCT domain-containing protein [Polaromonas sp. P1(28)-13]|nr:SHOCT domain-containing protein [Polaromonas sp. P1(28)-13]